MKNLIAIVLILSAGGIFYLITMPTYADIQVLSATKAKYSEALNNSQEAQGLRDALEAKYNGISPENLQRLGAFLPDSIDNIRLIIEIDKVAGKYNMALSNARVALAEKPSAQTIGEAIVSDSSVYGTGKLDFSVTGTYEDYISFVKDLEQSLRLINITSISLSGATSGTADRDIYNYKTSFDTYWLKQ
ncbi:MAG: hypothetical protein NT098_04150 [Candidatus Parcubacteria bacterium]|nr:hypothetical protein [Candidatus Parcubacteria bacterium]